jgi:hypothetical protein
MLEKTPIRKGWRFLIYIWLPASVFLYFYFYRDDIFTILKRLAAWLS